MINTSYAQSGFKTAPSFNASINKASDKLIKNFSRSFKDAENPKWASAGKNYKVNFTVDDMKYRVLYNKNGGRIYSIGYGVEKHLASYLIANINHNYPGYKINQAIHVKQHGRNIWLIQLEDFKSFITVRMEHDGLQEFEKIDKQL